MSRNVRNGLTVEAQSSADTATARAMTQPERDKSPAFTRLFLIAVGVIAVSVTVVMLNRAGPATHADRVGLITGLLAVTSLAATSAYLVILAVLHALPTGYSPVHHAVSDYGVGRYRPLFTVALYVSSVGVLTLALALLRGVGSPPLATKDLVYLLLIPIARIGMTLFPTNLEGERTSRTGLVHYAFAITAFTFTYLAISEMTPALRALDPSEWARTPLGSTEWIVGPALALVVITMLRPLRKIFGLFERVFLISTNLWFALAAVLLISRLG